MLDVLSSTATKRDARIYLSRFDPSKPSSQKHVPHPREATQKTGVNLGSLFQTPHAVETSPQFSQYPTQDTILDPERPSLHTAVLVIRSTSGIEDSVLKGLGHTVAQLSRLGLTCTVIVDDDLPTTDRASHQMLLQQVDRVVAAIEQGDTVRARRIDGLFYHRGPKDPKAVSAHVLKPTHIHEAFHLGIVPVAAPLIYNDEEILVGTNASGAALALARSFREGFAERHYHRKADWQAATMQLKQEISLDRIIILDPRGGIPQVTLGGSHVFVNLEQEFAAISQELETLLLPREQTLRDTTQNARSPNPLHQIATAVATISDSDVRGHLANLQLARGMLSMLPSTSSALITTPQAAAYSAVQPQAITSGPGVGTRSQRNPLIHNLLTDKPLFSSSLPRQRISAGNTTDTPTNHPSMHQAPPTHLKHGMPVVVFPDPLSRPWTPPEDTTFSMSLDDPRLDIARLVHLIEDSFGRPLDQDDYFSRIRPILAGVIIAGDYEGGAILTWEQPTSLAKISTPTPTPDNPRRLVPYLDKFAVLKRSQGAGGVADVVFSAMVRRCFPNGVCWRSRRGNPVNRWYFERSRGTYKLPLSEPGGQGWTMFWTTENLQPERFGEYAEVCAAVKSSWADGKRILD